MAETSDRTAMLVVVDNDDSVRRLMVRFLDGLDCAIIEFEETWQALNYIERNLTVDLVITDLNPAVRLSGLEFARRAHVLRPSLPFLIVTGAQCDSIDEPLTTLLRKPFRRADFMEAVQQCLRAILNDENGTRRDQS